MMAENIIVEYVVSMWGTPVPIPAYKEREGEKTKDQILLQCDLNEFSHACRSS